MQVAPASERMRALRENLRRARVRARLAVEPELLLTRPRAVIAARAGVMTLVTVFALAFDVGRVGLTTSLGFLAVLGTSYLTTAVALLAGRQRVSRGLLLTLFLVDVPLTTAVVHLTGGIESQFVVLYLFLILVSGMVLAGSGGTVVGAAASGAYALLLGLETGGYLAPIGYAGAEPRVFGTHGAADATQVGLYVTMFIGVGVFAGAAGRILHERVTALEVANRRLARARIDTAFVFSQLGSGLLSLDEDGRVLHFNRAAGEILGLDPAAVAGQPLAALGPGAQPFIDWIEEARRGAVPLMRQAVEIATPSGQPLPIGMSGSRVGHSGLIVVFQDLTLARREEADRARKEKLAAIGGLVGGITHEIRNGIRPVAGSLDVLLQEPAISGQNRRLLEIAVRECNRVGRFIQALLDYGRVTPLVLAPVDLAALLAEVEELVRLDAGEGIAIAVQVDPAARELTGLLDREQMKQVLLNLAQNAIEAMAPAGGELRFTLSREPLAAATGVEAAVIRVLDSGPGIPDDIADRIFEPFFTTKPGGTGFGLAIAAGIVERHGGSLDIKRDAARAGAVFEIRLPERAAFARPDLAATLAESA